MKIRITHTVDLSYEDESIQRYLYQRDCNKDKVSFRDYIQSFFIADGEFCMNQRKETYLEELEYDKD